MPCFAAISISCRKSGTKWSLTLMQLPRYGALDPMFPGEEHVSCSGRLLVSRGARQTLSIICADFGGIDIVESIGRKHGESVDAGARFRLPYLEWKLGSSLSALWLSDHPGSSPRLRPRDQFDLSSPPLPMPYMPLGRAFEVSDTVDGHHHEAIVSHRSLTNR